MKAFPLALLLVVASGPHLPGHHSFAAHYFEEQVVTVEGTVVQFDYTAPHAWVHVAIAEAGGERRIGAEWANPNRLTRDGIGKDTLKPGDHVIVIGSPGRNAAEQRMHLKGIERPADGWRWGRAR